MRRFFLTILLTGILGISPALSQEFVEFQVSPNFSYRLLNSSNSYLKDSLDGADKVRSSVGYGIGATFNIGDQWAITTGFRYNDYGFTRVWYDLQFHDVVHPDIGRIEDLSQAAQKDAFFFNKYRYLDVPIRFNYQISRKSQQQEYRIYLHGGLINQIFLQDEYKVFLKGFSVGGERTYRDIPTGNIMRTYNLAATAGARFILRITPSVWITAQPELSVPFLTHTENTDVNFRLIQLAGNFGIAKALP